MPRDQEGEFVTELFERMSGDVEEVVLEMYLFRPSEDRRCYRCLQQGEDPVSYIARRLEEKQREWRGGP